MTHLEDLITGLAAGIPDDAGDAESGVRVEITSVDLSVPIETRVGSDGSVRASLPRGRLATGYDVPLSQLVIRFDRGDG